jgi:hypothetical protein
MNNVHGIGSVFMNVVQEKSERRSKKAKDGLRKRW